MSEIQKSVKAAETGAKADEVANNVQRVLAERLGQTVDALDQMNKRKEANLAELGAFAEKVAQAIVHSRNYAAGLKQNIDKTDDFMARVARTFGSAAGIDLTTEVAS